MKTTKLFARTITAILCVMLIAGTVISPKWNTFASETIEAETVSADENIAAEEADISPEENKAPDGVEGDILDNAETEEAAASEPDTTAASKEQEIQTDGEESVDINSGNEPEESISAAGEPETAAEKNANEDKKQENSEDVNDAPDEKNTAKEEGQETYSDVEYVNIKTLEGTMLEAVLTEGEGSSSSATAINKLSDKYGIETKKLGEISGRLFNDFSDKSRTIEGKKSSKNGTSVDGVSIRWVYTKDDTLSVKENIKEAVLQINYSVSGKENFEAGDIIITIPDKILKDEKGNKTGEIILPYEEAPSDKYAFNYRKEGGEIIITNSREVNAQAKGYIQLALTGIDTAVAAETLASTAEVILPDEVIGLKSTDLKLEFDQKETQEESTEIKEGQKAEDEKQDVQKEEKTSADGDEGILSDDDVEIIPEAEDEPLLNEKNLSKETKKLAKAVMKAAPEPQTPVTADHITIEKVTIRWVSASTGEEESALYDDLILKPTNDIVPNQQWQLDVAFSGKDEIKAGDLEIVLPAYIWLDRDGNEPGIVTVAVPKEGTEGSSADFTWKRVGDSIVITNTKNLSAATKYMVQGTFRMTSPDPNSDPEYFTSTYAHQMVDGMNDYTSYKSNDLFGVINVTTPNTGEVISMTSNVINAVIDTHVEAANASKTAYDKYAKKYNVYYDHSKADIPNELLPANPDEYLYIKWYVDGRATGNQPFTMTTSDTVQDKIYKVEGTTETEIAAEGVMLGATGTAEGTVKSQDGKTITATLFEGYTEDDKSAYVWTAYKKSYFEGEDATFKIYNSQKISVTGTDDKITTTKDATASVAIRLPIVWTIKKEWLYNEDKYDTPLEVIKSRQPETLKVWLDNQSTGQTRVFSDTLSDENDWQTQYEDDGVVANYDAFEHTYQVTRHMHGENGTSIDIVTGRDDPVYTANGRWYYKYWGYDHKATKYDEETHTWTFVNDYHEGVIGGGYDNFEVSKKATNHTDEKQKSTADKDLNLLRNGKDSTSINYNVHTGTFCLGHTSEPGAMSWETDKHGKRYVTLELHDYGEYFESRKLGNDEFRMATVRMQLPVIYTWVPEKEGSENGTWEEADPVPVNLYAKGGDDSDWTLFAVMDTDGTITTYNGATVSGTTVSLPEGMNETKETIRTNGGRAYLDYNVGVILFPSDDIKEKIEEIFESTDYAKATSFNYVTGRLLDDDSNVLGELERYDRTYLHGRQLRLAADLDKQTTFVANDKEGKQLKFENKITLNQQSNLTSKSDFEDAFKDYDIPGSKSGTFYDLLPEGMTADETSVTIQNGTAKLIDVIDDYKGSGRQLLIVKADIEEDIVERDYYTRDSKRNDDSYPNITDINSSDALYGTKATMTFTSYYSYDEAKNRGITNLRNTAAYEADEEIFGNLPEWTGEKDAPTGENHKESLTEVEDYLRGMMTNLDEKSDNPNFVYAGDTYRITESDYDGLSSLRKYVQTAGDDADYWVDGLDNSVYVYEGGKYNYKIALTSDTDTMTKDIILIDSIEYYTPMEIKDPGTTGYRIGQIVSKRELDYRNSEVAAAGGTQATADEVWYWKGYFKSIDVSEIEAMGVDVKVYYSTVPDLDITHEAYNPNHTKEAVPAKLADKTVWSTKLPDDPSTVTAIALDCRKAADGSDFELHSQEALVAYVHMQAPTYEQQPDAYGEEGYNNPLNNGWAYNNVYMDITQLDEDGMAQETHSYDHYDYTKVGIWALDIEVLKEWDDENDNDRVRPDSVEVHLVKEGVDTGRSLTLDESNNWRGTFPHVLMFDEDGNRIYYSLNENPVEDYTSKIVYDSQNMTLVNSRETEKIDIPFVKKWTSEEPDGWQDNIPKFIKVRLYADGEFTGEIKTVRADENGDWSGMFTGMNKYKDGKEIVYTIEEDVPDDFICTIDQENKIITNTYYPYGDLSVEKTVVNGTDKALENEFTFTLLLKDEDGESVPNLFDYVITDADGVEKLTGQIGNGDTFKLKDGEKMTVKDIYAGVKYEVKEGAKAGFTLSSRQNTSGTIVSSRDREAKFENTYHAYGSVSFGAQKTLEGRDIDRYQFRFEVLDDTGKTIRLASNDKDGKATFGAINFTEADDGKVFTYSVIETDRGKGGYTYDDTVYKAEVRPVDNGDGTMTCSVTYTKDGQAVDAVEFKNEYHAEGDLELKAWKYLKGRELKDKEFTFVLKDEEGKEVARATNNADGTITFPKLHFDETDSGKEYDYVMSELTGNDETINYSDEEYKFHIAISDNGDGTLSFAQDVTGFKRTYRLAGSRWDSEDMVPKNPAIDLLPYGLAYLNGRFYGWFFIGIPGREVGEISFSYDGNFGGPRNYTLYEIHEDDIFTPEGGNQQGYTAQQIYEMMMQYPAHELKDGPATWYNYSFYGGDYEGRTLTDSESIPTGFYIVGNINYYSFLVVEREPSDEPATPVFTNTLKDGSVSIEKHVVNPEDADPEQTFKFRIEFEGDIEGKDFSGEISEAGSSGATTGNITRYAPAKRPAYSNLVNKIKAEPLTGKNKVQDENESSIADILADIWNGIKNAFVPITVQAAETIIHSGKYGGIDWRITSDGELILGKTGETQTSTATIFINSAGWWSKQDDIKSIKIEGTVKIPQEAYGLFSQEADLTKFDLTGLDLSDATSINSMFQICTSLTDADLSDLDVRNVTDIGSLFRKCSSLKTAVLPDLNGANITKMSSMFYECSSIESVDLSGINTANVTEMGSLFSGCKNLSSVTLGKEWTKWDSGARLPSPPSTGAYTGKWVKVDDDGTIGAKTSDQLQEQYPANADEWAGTWVWEASAIAVFDSSDGSLKFYNAETAKTFEPTATQTVYKGVEIRDANSDSYYSIASWASEHADEILSVKVVDEGIAPLVTSGWFVGCSNLTDDNIDLSKLDTSKLNHMGGMFRGCSSLTSVDLSNFDVSKVTSVVSLFDGCTNLSDVKLPDFDAGALKCTMCMFEDCSSLETITLNAFNTENVTSMYQMFKGCSSLTKLDISGFDMSKVTSKGNMLNGLTSLKELTLGNDNDISGTSLTDITDMTGYDSDLYTGKWVRKEFPDDPQSSSDLMNQTGVDLAGTWVWESAIKEYTVSFDANGGTGSMTDDVVEADKDYTITPNKFVRFGYKFKNWNTDVAGSGKTYTDKIPANTYRAEDKVTLYAQWEAIEGLTKIADGVYEFELQDNMKMTIDDIPAGTTYRVYEETPDGWVLVSQSGENGIIKPVETAKASFTNKYTPGTTSVQFTGTKHIDGKPGNGFTFVLKEGDEEIERVTSSNGMIQFSQITYDSPGTHTYTIEEVAGDDEAVIYDEHKETVTVKVIDNGDGTMSKEVTYDKDGILFENETKEEYLYGELEIEKKAETTNVNKDDEFTFQIYLANENGIPYSDDVSYTIGSEEKIAKPSSGTITVSKIKAGDKIAFLQLPAGTKYIVSETNLPDGWNLSGVDSESGAIEANNTESVVVTNEYKASGSVVLEAHKKLEGDTPSRGDYIFELKDEDGTIIDRQTNDSQDNNQFILGDNGERVDNPWYRTAPVSFTPISYTQDDIGKTFTYTISESAGSDGNVVYDTHTETVTVKVSDAGEGFLDTDVTYSDGEGVLFTNSMKTGELSINKEISHYTDAAKGTEFSFTIELLDEKGNALDSKYPYVKTVTVTEPVTATRVGDDGEEEEYDTGETAEVQKEEKGTIASGDKISLKGSDSVVISGLPDGAAYKVTEASAPAWELVEAKNSEGNIKAAQTAEASFHNVYYTEGSVIFEATKKLIGRDIIPDTYEFMVTDTNGDIVDHAYAKEDGTIAFNGIDYTEEDDGKTYTYYIEEVQGDEEDISYDTSAKEVTVKVKDNGKGTLECEVTYDESGMEFVNEVSYSLSVSKQVTGDKADPDRSFSFRISLDDVQKNNISYTKWEGETQIGSGIIRASDLPYDFSLTSKETIVFSRIQDGATYTLTEVDDPYYTAADSEISGAIEGADAEETFVNDINWFEISFDKVNKEGNLIKGAKMSIYQDDELVEEWTTDGTSHTTKLLPGDYILKEEAVPEGDIYIMASEIAFTVNTDGTVEYDGKETEDARVNMTDDYVKTEVSIAKTWDDDDDRDGKRPESVVIRLLADGEDTGLSVTLNNENGWKHTFSNLDKYADEELIEYTVTEDDTSPYTVEIKDSDAGFEIINQYTPERINVSGSKVWDDVENQDGIRPEKITINLLADGELLNSSEVTEEGEWKFEFTDLPKMNDGKEIKYTITEDPVEGYDCSVSGDVENGFKVTNTHVPGTTSIRVSKDWQDNDNTMGIRPEVIEVSLIKKIEDVETVFDKIEIKADKNGDWSGNFNNLPVEENGKKIEYDIEEAEVTGYVPDTIKEGDNVIRLVNSLDTSGEKPTPDDDKNRKPDKGDKVTDKNTTTAKSTTVKSPKTGDDSNIIAYLLLIIAAATTIVVATYRRKRNRG